MLEPNLWAEALAGMHRLCLPIGCIAGCAHIPKSWYDAACQDAVLAVLKYSRPGD